MNQPIQLDLKDQKILSELNRNSRQSFSQIGKAVKLPKSVVSFRVKKLTDTGIIDLFCTIINKYALGYRYARVFLKFSKFNESVEKELLHFLSKRKNINLIATLHGRYDFYIASLVRDIKDFNEIYSQIIYKFHHYLLAKDLSITHGVYNFQPCYLPKVRNNHPPEYRGFQPHDFDYHIINLIKENSRIPLLDIAAKTKLSPQSVRKRIQKLIKEGVLMSFRIRLNHQLAGYHHFHTFLTLSKVTEKDEKEIISFLSSLPSTLKITKSIGKYDLEFESLLKSNFQLHEIVQNLRNQFPKQIQTVDEALIYKIHPINTMKYS